MAMPYSHAPQEESRFNAANWTVLCAAVLILALSLAQVLYRKSLPTDGWDLDYFAVADKGQLVYRTNISGLASPLQSGDALVSIEGESADDILRRALTLQSEPPERWQAGHA